MPALPLEPPWDRVDDRIHPLDRAAIARARVAGVLVTLVTGRLPARALPPARSLGLACPILCADGALVLSPRSGAVHQRAAIGARTTRAVAALAAQTGLPALFLADQLVLGARAHAGLAGWLAGWTPHFLPVDAPPNLPLLAAFLLGAPTAVAQARTRLARAIGPRDALDLVPLGAGIAALRARPRAADKARALAGLAAQLGIDRAEVAAVGDWHNDVSMLRYAAHSFAMAEAPAAVATAAKRRLVATAATGGAIAEVVGEILGGK